MSEDLVVRMRGIRKSFGQTQALRDLNLEIRSGRIVGVLGANGSGKSTLLRHMIGLYLPDRGECVTFGVAAGKLGPAELGRIGYVHQEGALLDWMSVAQLIRYVRAYYPSWDEGVQERLLADSGVSLDARVGALSPGQRQRVAVVLAVCFDPDLLILDEPAAAMDPVARADFLDLLLQMIQKPGRTIVISSHILSDVEKVIDHVVILKKGRVVRDCALDDLREEFCRVRLTSLDGHLPAQLPFEGVVDSKRNEAEAVLTLRGAERERVEEAPRAINCTVEFRALSLDDLYRIVVA